MSASDLVFGTQYYRPPFPNREAWNRDLNLIAASGMNTVKSPSPQGKAFKYPHATVSRS